MKKIIAHRGNLNGPNRLLENLPIYIDDALNKNYEAEIDLHYDNNKLYLGHDFPQHEITFNWLKERSQKLWIHCKTFSALAFCNEHDELLNYFFHDLDKYIITSKKFIWAYPGNYGNENTIIVMPEHVEELEFAIKLLNTHGGICTDYAERVRNETIGFN